MSSEIPKVKAILILDIIGKPPEHLVKALEEIIGDMDKEEGVSVQSKKIKEPTLMKDQKEFYTTFAEVEVETDSIINLAILMFKYMPAHIDVVTPEFITLQNNLWNDILNELVRRLHAYDEVARVIQIENQNLKVQLQKMLQGSVKIEEDLPKKKSSKKKTKKK